MSICKYGAVFVEFGTYWPARFLRLLTVFVTISSPSKCIILRLYLFSIFSICLILFKYVYILQIYHFLCNNFSFISGHFTQALYSLLFCQLWDLDTSTITSFAVRNPRLSDTAPCVVCNRLCYKVPNYERY